MSDKRFPNYEEEDYNNSQKKTKSQVMKELSDYTNPDLTKSEALYDENDLIKMPTIYGEPIYLKPKEINETRPTITKQVQELPPYQKESKTLEIYQNKTIIIEKNEKNIQQEEINDINIKDNNDENNVPNKKINRAKK